MKQTMRFLVAMTFASAAAAAAETASEVVSTRADRESTTLTVYNDDLALIKERRRITLPAGLSRLSLREVSAQLRPETAMLRATSGRPLTVLEQNFDFDLLTPETLLEKYVGREVSVLRPHPTSGEERREKATVLAASNGTVLRFADRIETGAPGRIVFDSVPANLRDRPTLSLLLDAAGGSQSLELSYLSGGLSWQADYVANLAADGRSMDLSAWVTLNNRSGTRYEDATLQLVAGKPNRVAPPTRPMLAYAAPAMRAKAAEVAEESLLDYHLYSFERPTTIADKQSKQLALLSAAAIPVRRDYVLAGADYYYRERFGQIAQKIKPAVFVEFANKGGQLGKPLPAGVIRVYARDSKGAAQFVGEDRIGHTAKNENLRLKLGEAFDISADRKQTSYRKLGENSAESAFHLELRNARDEAVSVRIEEPLPGDWEIVQETQKSTKESARVAVWNLSVPANGSATLDYTARVRW